MSLCIDFISFYQVGIYILTGVQMLGFISIPDIDFINHPLGPDIIILNGLFEKRHSWSIHHLTQLQDPSFKFLCTEGTQTTPQGLLKLTALHHHDPKNGSTAGIKRKGTTQISLTRKPFRFRRTSRKRRLSFRPRLFLRKRSRKRNTCGITRSWRCSDESSRGERGV